MLAKLAQTLPPETHEDFYPIVNEMTERKEKHFAQYNRPIIDYELTDMGHDYHLSVISMMMPEKEDDDD